MTSTTAWDGTFSSDPYAYRSFFEIRGALDPLIQRLCEYDTLRIKLEQQGGNLAEIRLLTARLAEPLSLHSNGIHREASLTDPENLREALRVIGARNVYFSVRVRPSGLPAYYLVRVKHGYWSEYSLLVEDVYRSPNYPNPDDRFVKLMDFGHETYFLRLSQFRDKAASRAGGDETSRDRDTDEVLHNVGRQIFQAAWHEDQYPAFQAAEHFGLPRFRQAIELLYLCLSGDLCAIRASLDDDVSDFFASVYPQPAIHAFLKQIANLEGNALARIPEDALEAFARLSRLYGSFLRVEVRRGPRACAIPVYKLLFANFGRLDRIAPGLALDGGVVTAAARLEEAAAEAIREIANSG